MTEAARWRTSKKPTSEWPLIDVEAFMEVKDNCVQFLYLTDKAGNKVRITGLHNYGVEIHLVSPPPTVKKWRVDGEILGVKVIPQLFDSRYEADEYIRDAIVASREKALLTCDEVEVVEK